MITAANVDYSAVEEQQEHQQHNNNRSPAENEDHKRTEDDDDMYDYFPPPVSGGYAQDPQQQGCCGRCLSHKVTRFILKFAFSTAGLCIIVILYTVGGAFIMRACESGEEKDRLKQTRLVAIEIESNRIILAETLKALIWNKRHENQTDIEAAIKAQLDGYHALVEQAIKLNKYDGTMHVEGKEKYGWEVASALLFTATVLTTIGYGHVYPVTEIGQVVLLLYSLFAIPIMSLFLINIGSAIANMVRFIYPRCCCRLCRKRRKQLWETIDGETSDDSENHIPVAGRPKTAWSMDQDGNPKEPRDQHLVEEEAKEEEPSDVPASLSVLIVAIYLLSGTVIFSWMEGHWTLINSFYFTFVSLISIGFGDFVPGRGDVDTVGGSLRLAFTTFYMIFGLAVLAMGVDLATTAMAQRVKKLAETIKESARKKNKVDEKVGSTNDCKLAPTPNPYNPNDHIDDITPPGIVYR